MTVSKSGVIQRLIRVLAALSLTVVLNACIGDTAGGLEGEQGTFVATGKEAADPQAVGGSAAASAQKIFAANAFDPSDGNNEEYRIAPLDVVEISVFGVAELNRTAQVGTTGMISLPLIKQVKAAGKTQAQLEKDIATKLEANYLQQAQVSVLVKEYNSQRITVDGAVNKPGIYPISGATSLTQAVALAQGLGPLADTSGVILFRTVNNKRMAARFDIKQIRTGKMDDPRLQAGDIVMVDESKARTTLRDIKEALPLQGLFSLLLL